MLTQSLAVVAARALDATRHADPLHGSRTLAPRIFVDTEEDQASNVILAVIRGHAVRRVLSASSPSLVDESHNRTIRATERRRQQRVSLLRTGEDAAWCNSARQILAMLIGNRVRRQYGFVV